MALPSVERVREVLDYDPESGVFRWKVRPSNRVRVGEIAGCVEQVGGYRLISVDGKLIKAARLAWFYMHGEWPPMHVDHENLIRDDDRIRNIRPCTRSENQRNRSRQSNNTSGYKGVTWHRGLRKWAAQINVRGRKKFLGSFLTPSAAAKAYDEAAKVMHGTFARVNGG